LFSQQDFVLWDWDVNLKPNPKLGGPECLSLSGTSPVTCPAWETLPVAKLPLAYLLRTLAGTNPTTMTRQRHRQGDLN